MPYKRRLAKQRHAYSPTVQALLDGAPVACNEAVREELTSIWYFGRSDRSVPPEAIAAAGEVLAGWRKCRAN